MKHATATLEGTFLDVAVHLAIGANFLVEVDGAIHGITPPEYSNDWAHGGPLIEVHEISLTHRGLMEWFADAPGSSEIGPTPLIAAMRALVASKLGDEVEL